MRYSEMTHPNSDRSSVLVMYSFHLQFIVKFYQQPSLYLLYALLPVPGVEPANLAEAAGVHVCSGCRSVHDWLLLLLVLPVVIRLVAPATG